MNTTDNAPTPETPAVSDAVPIQEELTPEQNAMLADAIARRLRKARRQKHNTKGAFGKSRFQSMGKVEVGAPTPSTASVQPKSLDIGASDGVGLPSTSDIPAITP